MVDVHVMTPRCTPTLSANPARTLLGILTAARDSAEPHQEPGADDPTSPKEGITHERTAA